jgi:DNA polymerase theta
MTDSNGVLVRTLEAAPVSKDPNDCVMVHLVQETINAGGSVLVFCASKSDAVNAARVLAEHLSMPEPPAKSMAQDDMTREEALERISLARPPEKQQPYLAECVAKGVAFHNSSLNLDEREVVQDCFRFGKIRVICCTSTLAAGVNLPARLVILRQDHTFGSSAGDSTTGPVPLQPAQYQQMAGRAGRTGLDTTGESIILAKPNANAAHMAELRKLVLPDPRPLTSALASRSPAEGRRSNEYFKLFVLYAVSSGLVVTDMDMQRYVECTLLATLQTPEERKDDVLRSRFNQVAQQLFKLMLVAKEQAKDVPPGMPKPVRRDALHFGSG